MKQEILTKLEVFNNSNFKFDPKYHKYTLDGEEFISVTKFISRFHEEFDTEYWSKIKSDELGVDQNIIKADWKRLNDYANDIGTQTHNWIENYYNDVSQRLPINLDVIDRINKFNVVYAKHLYKLDPVKFEVRIFSKRWKIAGMIDSIFIRNGKIYIVDYKTNKKFTEKNDYGEKLLEPFEEFDKCHLTEYSIQISLYCLILKEYGFDIGGGYLLYIGPDGPAELHKCINMMDILEKYLNETFIS